ncbi:MAG TPA: methyltransferase domain-containing protein [bacterium]|nr:methyltransferase domain-containing protein [bacterium]
MSCCTPAAYGTVFDGREARRSARTYRKKGLDPTARRIVRFLSAQEDVPRTVLEIGGGIGALQMELLRAGASRTTNIELSPAYEAVAQSLLADAGLTDHVQRHLGDFAAAPEAFPLADVVIMHRVVCCYPEVARLVRSAADHAQRYLAMSYPRDAWWVRGGLAAENLLLFSMRGIGFRVFVHSPQTILAIASSYGFTPAFQHRGWVWEAVVLRREPGSR